MVRFVVEAVPRIVTFPTLSILKSVEVAKAEVEEETRKSVVVVA